MKHDFTSIPDRSSFGAAKWNRAKNSSTEFVPLSVADMEFPTAKLFERYNVFEADSAVNMIAGDKLFEAMVGKDIRKLIGTDVLNTITGTAEPVEGRRPLQLCTFIGVEKDMRVIYSHYSKTISDFPEIKDVIKAMI